MCKNLCLCNTIMTVSPTLDLIMVLETLPFLSCGVIAAVKRRHVTTATWMHAWITTATWSMSPWLQRDKRASPTHLSLFCRSFISSPLLNLPLLCRLHRLKWTVNTHMHKLAWQHLCRSNRARNSLKTLKLLCCFVTCLSQFVTAAAHSHVAQSDNNSRNSVQPGLTTVLSLIKPCCLKLLWEQKSHSQERNFTLCKAKWLSKKPTIIFCSIHLLIKASCWDWVRFAKIEQLSAQFTPDPNLCSYVDLIIRSVNT